MILPVFDYCDIVFSNSSGLNLDRLEKLQNRAARAITGYPPWHSATELRQKLGWISIQNRWLIHKCIIVFKCLNDLVPPYLSSKFNFVNDTHHVNTRSSADKHLAINGCHLWSFQYQGAMEWNKLPLNIRAINSLYFFKSTICKHLST